MFFHGRTAIITGAGTGLGRIYALELSKRGANVVINDIKSLKAVNSPNVHEDITLSQPADELVKYINGHGGKAIASYHDVRSGELIVQDTLKAFGRVDILINNAGILRDKSFSKISKADWYDVINIHLNGTFEVSHAVWPHMVKQGYGRIVNVSSGAGLYGNFGQSNYSAAKMALVGLTNTLAIEGKKNNILVNCVVPIAASKMTENILPSSILAQLQPEHISPMVTYLSHENCDESGGIFELGAGWYSKIRLERSKGISLGGKDNFATAEIIFDNIKQISDFKRSTHPSTLAASLGEMIEASSRRGDKSRNAPPTKSEQFVEHYVIKDVIFKTDKVFSKVSKYFGANPKRAKEVALSVNARILISIISIESSTKDWYVDFKSDIPNVQLLSSSSNHVSPDVKISCSDEIFLSLVKGDISPEMAFMTGNLKVKGPIHIATKIKPLLELSKSQLDK